MKIKNLALAALAAFAFTQSASATTITYVGTEEASGTANWSSVGVAKTYSIAGSNKYGTAGYYQICPMATPSNDPISVSDGNDLGVTASPWPTLYVKPAFVSAISGFAGTLVRYGYPLFRGPDGSTLYNQGALSVNLPNGGTSPSGPGNWGNTFQFTLGQSGSFRLGMAVDAVAAGTYAPNYISVYSAATGTVFSGPIARDATPKMVFFDIVGNAGDVFGIAQWQVGGDWPFGHESHHLRCLGQPPHLERFNQRQSGWLRCQLHGQNVRASAGGHQCGVFWQC